MRLAWVKPGWVYQNNEATYGVTPDPVEFEKGYEYGDYGRQYRLVVLLPVDQPADNVVRSPWGKEGWQLVRVIPERSTVAAMFLHPVCPLAEWPEKSVALRDEAKAQHDGWVAQAEEQAREQDVQYAKEWAALTPEQREHHRREREMSERLRLLGFERWLLSLNPHDLSRNEFLVEALTILDELSKNPARGEELAGRYRALRRG